jgi:hypothetical protein
MHCNITIVSAESVESLRERRLSELGAVRLAVEAQLAHDDTLAAMLGVSEQALLQLADAIDAAMPGWMGGISNDDLRNAISQTIVDVATIDTAQPLSRVFAQKVGQAVQDALGLPPGSVRAGFVPIYSPPPPPPPSPPPVSYYNRDDDDGDILDHDDSDKLRYAVGLISGLLLISFIGCCVIVWCKKRQKQQKERGVHPEAPPTSSTAEPMVGRPMSSAPKQDVAAVSSAPVGGATKQEDPLATAFAGTAGSSASAEGCADEASAGRIGLGPLRAPSGAVGESSAKKAPADVAPAEPAVGDVLHDAGGDSD